MSAVLAIYSGNKCSFRHFAPLVLCYTTILANFIIANIILSMRLLIDARESGTSTGTYIDKLIEYLAKLKPGFEIIILAKPGRVEFIKQIAPVFLVKESNIKEFSFAEQTKLLRQINALRPDLVHFGMVQQPVLYRGRTVTTIHDLTTARFRNPAKNFAVFWFKQQVYKWLIKRVSKKSKKLIVPSSYVKDDLAKYSGVNQDKIVVTYEAADPITDSPAAIENLTSKVFLIYVGRSQPHKNLKRLVDAFLLLHQKRPGLLLVLAGKPDANQAKLIAHAKKLGIDKYIITTGYVSGAQLKWLYQNTAAYVFPSLSEGFGLPGLEAMVHGAPVVASNFSCLPEVYGKAAHYFNPESVDEIADKISEVLDSAGLRTELTARGKKQAAKYSWSQTAGQTLAVYKDILGGA